MELCIISFISPYYIKTAPEAPSEAAKSLPLPGNIRGTPTPYVGPDTKKSCP